MEFKQKQGQHQRLLINLAMRQAFRVLKMPILELAPYVERQIDANPLLERVETELQGTPPEPIDIPSLYRYLMDQVQRGDFSQEEKGIAQEIIGNLDERGFYLDSISGKKQVLKKIQQLDPPGIGATSLQESLLIQLEQQGKKGTALYQKVLEDFKHCGKEIRGLNLFPALLFSTTLVPPQIPDVLVEEKVRVNQDTIPEFAISPYYTYYLEKGVEERYLLPHIAKAKWLQRNLEKRASTLELITYFLMEKGQRYFQGEDFPLPKTTLREMSEKLGLHPSTLSRAINGKSILSPGGHVPLKAFFTHGEPKALLKELISQETKAQSDEELAYKLKIARRTVTKYRKELGIPNSRKRQSVY